MYARPGLLELEPLADPVGAVHGEHDGHAVVAGGQQAGGADPGDLGEVSRSPGATVSSGSRLVFSFITARSASATAIDESWPTWVAGEVTKIIREKGRKLLHPPMLASFHHG